MAQDKRFGTLTVLPVSANLIRDTEIFGHMDPYCVIKLGGQAQKTAVKLNAGKFPEWDDRLVFRKTTETEICIRVWDRDRAKRDDLIGETNLPIHSLIGSSHEFDGWIDLKYKNKLAGQIRIQSHFIPEVQQQW